TTSLTGFSGKTTWPLGQLRLLVTIGDVTHSTKEWMNFIIVKSLSPYNGIIGRPGLKAIQAVPSTVHGMLKFLTEEGIVTIRNSLLIPAESADEEKTAFHTGQGVYCYTKMPFGLKNAGATYQRLMDKAFESQIGRNIEVYVDDLVVKSHTEAEMVRDIEETFQTLRKINMKLNPKKCSFGLAKGVFLVYVITPEGIKPCLDKTTAVLQLPSPQTIKESDFCWTAKAEQAFQQLKQHLLDLPLLAAPKPQEELIMYLSATHGAISTQKDFKDIFRHILSRSSLTSPSNRSCLVPTWQDDCKSRALCWESITLHTDRGHGSGAGLILTNPEGVEFTYALRFQFAASNNKAEYEALIAGLRIATQMGVKNIQANVDSKLIANQVLGTYVAKEDNMIKYLEIAKGLVSEFKTFSISHIPRSKNKKADALSKIASTSFAHLSKQIEAKAVATITRGQVKKFVWDNIVCRFGIPGEIISDNGKQFADNPFKDWCDKLNITQHFASVKHPQSNGLVERANRCLGEEIGMPTYRTTTVDVVNNDEELRLNLDLLEERQELAAMSEAKSKSKMMKYYNSRVRGMAFKPGDFVCRSNDASHALAGGKLGPKWEGPYEVTDALGNGAYKLRSTDRTVLPRM
nr:reverse transcriptase domain-containing protein [Tanacetum cinerariifolium]